MKETLEIPGSYSHFSNQQTGPEAGTRKLPKKMETENIIAS
jgi:hypothetical protein